MAHFCETHQRRVTSVHCLSCLQNLAEDLARTIWTETQAPDWPKLYEPETSRKDRVRAFSLIEEARKWLRAYYRDDIPEPEHLDERDWQLVLKTYRRFLLREAVTAVLDTDWSWADEARRGERAVDA